MAGSVATALRRADCPRFFAVPPALYSGHDVANQIAGVAGLQFFRVAGKYQFQTAGGRHRIGERNSLRRIIQFQVEAVGKNLPAARSAAPAVPPGEIFIGVALMILNASRRNGRAWPFTVTASSFDGTRCR